MVSVLEDALVASLLTSQQPGRSGSQRTCVLVLVHVHVHAGVCARANALARMPAALFAAR